MEKGDRRPETGERSERSEDPPTGGRPEAEIRSPDD